MVAPLALSPSVSPGPRPVNLLNAIRAPFHVHPPHSVASSSCLLSVRFLFICRLPSGASCHLPSAHTPDWRHVPCCPWCPGQCPGVWGFAPPTCAAGGTGLGCGWRGVGDDAPPDGLEVLNTSRHTDQTNDRSIFGALDTPRSSWCSSLSAPPPPYPFPRTTVLVPIPSLPMGGCFCGRPARPLPVGPSWPRTRRPPKRCQGPVPRPTSPFHCLAHGPVAS